MSAQILWFLNRGSGVVLVGVLTASVVLGILSSRVRPGGRIPAFVSQSLHRNLSLLGLLLLVVHVATAVLDEYVDIRWWHTVVPWGAAYEPWWLAVGTLATDLLLAICLLTVVRERVGQRAWRRVHRTAYLAWGLGIVHGIGIGTDTREEWVLATVLACGALVGLAVVARGLAAPGDVHLPQDAPW